MRPVRAEDKIAILDKLPECDILLEAIERAPEINGAHPQFEEFSSDFESRFLDQTQEQRVVSNNPDGSQRVVYTWREDAEFVIKLEDVEIVRNGGQKSII